MSVEHITTEAISLKVTDEDTRKLAGRIIEQFTRLNKGERIEFGEIYNIKMSVNGQTATASKKPLNSEGKPVFDSESEIVKLLGTDDIRELEMQLDYSAMVLLGGCYGYSFLQDLCEEFDSSVLAKLDYKLLEYYDCDETIVAYLLRDGKLINIEPTATLSDVSDIGAWFSYNFMLSISADDEFDDETLDKLTIMAEDFAEKYIDGDYDEPDECEMILESSVALKAEEITAFKEDLDAFISYANEVGLNAELTASFTPDDGFQKYAYINFELSENGTEMKIAVGSSSIFC